MYNLRIKNKKFDKIFSYTPKEKGTKWLKIMYINKDGKETPRNYKSDRTICIKNIKCLKSAFYGTTKHTISVLEILKQFLKPCKIPEKAPIQTNNKKLENTDISCSVIITASKIPSHPSIKIIKQTIESIQKFVKSKNNFEIILSHDYNISQEYQQYKSNLLKYIQDKPNIKLINCPSRLFLTGNIKYALDHVKSEFVLIMQHDLPFIKEINLDDICTDFNNNSIIKHVRFTRMRKMCDRRWGNAKRFFGKYVLHGCNKNIYTSTAAWCDNNHICRANYYENYVFKHMILPSEKNKRGKVGGMETQIGSICQTDKHFDKQGTFIYGVKFGSPYISHLDGRRTK